MLGVNSALFALILAFEMPISIDNFGLSGILFFTKQIKYLF